MDTKKHFLPGMWNIKLPFEIFGVTPEGVEYKMSVPNDGGNMVFESGSYESWVSVHYCRGDNNGGRGIKVNEVIAAINHWVNEVDEEVVNKGQVVELLSFV